MNDTLMVIGTMVSAACAVVMLVFMFTNRSQKREIVMSPEALTRREFDEARHSRDEEIHRVMAALEKHVEVNRQEHEGMHKKIGGVERGSQARIDESSRKFDASCEKLHMRINDLLKAIGVLEGKIEEQNK